MVCKKAYGIQTFILLTTPKNQIIQSKVDNKGV